MKKPIVTHRQVRYIVGWTDKHHGTMHQLFVTDSSEYASKWCLRFNALVVKYKKFLEQFEMTWENGMKDVKEEYFSQWYIRWSDIQNIEGASVFPLDYREGCYWDNP